MKKNTFWVPLDGNLKKLLMTMKLTLLILLLSSASILASSVYSQNTTLSIHVKNCTMKELIEEIENQSEFIFVYYDDVVDLDRRVTVNLTNQTVDKILDAVFESTDNTYKIYDRQITIGKKQPLASNLSNVSDFDKAMQQKKEITGTVLDSKGEPIPGATVIIKDTTIGIVTDLDGKFNLSIPEKSKVLVVSFVGYEPQEIVIGNISSFKVVLLESTLGIDEVVAVGYGTQKKESVTAAISSIQNDDLVKTPQANISNALSGRLPGLFTVQPQGEPGDSQSIIKIRGQGTFSGDTDPLILVDGIEVSNYNNIDPNEIENISVLKDASATAVYGVRGANGALIITTKRGDIGKPKVSISANYAMTKFTEMSSFADSYDYARNYNEALKYESYITGSYIPKYTESDLEHYLLGDDPIFHPNTDWVDLMVKSASKQFQSNLNIRGGTEKVKYFISTGIFTQEGLFNNTDLAPGFDAQIKYHRYNFRSNFDFDVTKDLVISVDLSSQIENRKSPGASSQYTLERIFRVPPTTSPGIVDGKVVSVYEVFGGNPLTGLLGSGSKRIFNNDLKGTVKFNYKMDFITKGLSSRGNISYLNRMMEQKTYTKTLIEYYPSRLDDGTIIYAPQADDQPFGFSSGSDRDRKIYLEFGFNYARTFEKHDVSGLILYNQSKLYDPGLAYLVPNGYQGVVGRLAYDFDKRYLAEFNIGYNGTENFAKGKRFGFFPAFSLGWVLSEEKFFPENSIISYVKFRGSYGEVGNDKIGGTRFIYRPSSYTYTNGTFTRAYWGEIGSTFQGYEASNEGLLGNPGLTWERAKKSNIGMDVRFFEGDLRLNADYFVENRDNILASPGNLPNIVGISFPTLNMGEMKNSGYEIELEYNNKIGDFSYYINGNYTYAHNVVEFQDEVIREFTYQYRTGQRLGQKFGLIAEGFYNTWEEVNDPNRPVSTYQNNRIQPGDVKYKDVNGDGLINSDDVVPIGYSNFPEKVFGLSFGGKYKNFDFSVLFQGAANVTLSYSKIAQRGYQEERSVKDFILEYSWTQERYEQGMPIKFPRLGVDAASHNYQYSSLFMVDASYLRLKNMELGYTFKISKVLNSARVYLNGYNLFTLSNVFPGVDPEIHAPTYANYEPYPPTRIYNIGVNINF